MSEITTLTDNDLIREGKKRTMDIKRCIGANLLNKALKEAKVDAIDVAWGAYSGRYIVGSNQYKVRSYFKNIPINLMELEPQSGEPIEITFKHYTH